MIAQRHFRPIETVCQKRTVRRPQIVNTEKSQQLNRRPVAKRVDQPTVFDYRNARCENTTRGDNRQRLKSVSIEEDRLPEDELASRRWLVNGRDRLERLQPRQSDRRQSNEGGG